MTEESAKPKPPWLRRRAPACGQAGAVRATLAELNLHTVCAGAHCPNLPECFARGTATFLILGDRCTRSCRFCAIPQRGMGVSPVIRDREQGRDARATHGRDAHATPPREDEPAAVAEAAARMNLRHVVITSVTRDDLPDGGASHFAAAIRAVRERLPAAVIEVLVPDFGGSTAALDAVLAARPDVFNHNVETVLRLYPLVRPQADYGRSLAVLAYAGKHAGGGLLSLEGEGRVGVRQGSNDPHPALRATLPLRGRSSPEPALPATLSLRGRGVSTRILTKSGLMVGLGETDEEVLAVLRDLRAAGCELVTIGQYLAPSPANLPVARYVEPARFAEWEGQARELGFLAAFAGPFVRSSYQAEALFHRAAL